MSKIFKNFIVFLLGCSFLLGIAACQDAPQSDDLPPIEDVAVDDGINENSPIGYLVENGETAYKVVYPVGAESAVNFAMSELSRYLGEATGVDLGGESTGRVPDAAWKKEAFSSYSSDDQAWNPGDMTNLAIGQGDILVTPLQMAMVYCGLANGGVQMVPNLLKSVVARDGELLTPDRRIWPDDRLLVRKVASAG